MIHLFMKMCVHRKLLENEEPVKEKILIRFVQVLKNLQFLLIGVQNNIFK